MDQPKLYHGRPADCASRDAAETACYDALDALGIDYIRATHDALFTMEALAPVEALLGCGVAKNLFLTNRQQTDLYLLIMPGDKPFKTKYLSAQLGCSRLSFGSEELLMDALGVTHGSASVLCLLRDKANHVRLLGDRELLGAEYFACHPCRNTTTLRFPTADLTNKLLPALHHEITWVDLPREVE